MHSDLLLFVRSVMNQFDIDVRKKITKSDLPVQVCEPLVDLRRLRIQIVRQRNVHAILETQSAFPGQFPCRKFRQRGRELLGMLPASLLPVKMTAAANGRKQQA